MDNDKSTMYKSQHTVKQFIIKQLLMYTIKLNIQCNLVHSCHYIKIYNFINNVGKLTTYKRQKGKLFG